MQDLGNFTDVAEFACEVCQAKTNEIADIKVPCGYRSLADEYCPMLLKCAARYCDVTDKADVDILYIDGIAGTKPDTALQAFAKTIKKASKDKIQHYKQAYRDAHPQNNKD